MITTSIATKAGIIRVTITRKSNKWVLVHLVMWHKVYSKKILYKYASLDWLVCMIDASLSHLDDPDNIVPLTMRLIRKQAITEPTKLFDLLSRNPPFVKQPGVKLEIRRNATLEEIMGAICELARAAERIKNQ